MTNIGHFRAAGKLLASTKEALSTRLWIAPPTKMDQHQLMEEGYYSIYGVKAPAPKCPAARCVWATKRASRPIQP